MNESEAQTRKNIIDKRLKQAGWNLNDPAQVTQELDIWVGIDPEAKKRNDKYQGHLFADYVLLGPDNYPLAVVEAKKTSVDPRVGKEQARNYAAKIQKNNDMDMPFVFYTNGYDLYYWDTERYPPRKIYGFPTREELNRIRFLRNNLVPLSESMINTDIAGRDYQIQAIRSVLETVEKKRRKILLVMATGTGKTRTCMALIDVLMRANWVQKVLFLVDRLALQEQALDAFKEFLPNAPVWPQQGEKELATDRRVYVSTYPTILNIIENDEYKLSPHFFDLVIADESHRSIYNVYKNIFDYFDALQLGLTATPKDNIDHNTFKLFECEEGLPTFAYSYDEAVKHKPPYLCDFEVLRIKTKFQQEGINRGSISEQEVNRLIEEGIDPDQINFEGTDLEKKVTNKGTNTLIVRQFMEECIKDENGVLPGKTIFFAMTKKHAYRLCDIFNSLYPEYKGKLAEVIISDIKGVHGKGGILDRFKKEDLPRIAISVDMLDTGIDVLEIVNLVFAKPVFSYTKFWQMIGRGTRVLNQEKIKPWCRKKDKFLIIDCWENFEYFKLNPKGKVEKPQKPLPVRLFEAKINKLDAAVQLHEEKIREKTIMSLRKDINCLPKNSVIVLENKAELVKYEDDVFWLHLNSAKLEQLSRIAPIMRACSEVDFKAMRFEIDVTDLATAKLVNNLEKYETLKSAVLEQIEELPLSVNIVAKEQELIERVIQDAYWSKATDDDYDILIEKLGPLMRFREQEEGHQEKLDIQDILNEKLYIEFGPEHERLPTEKYRQRIEEMIKKLAENTLVLQKLIKGQEITAKEIESLAEILEKKDPFISEDLLRRVYDNRQAKFIQFIKHILGIEKLTTFEETVNFAFDSFLREHNNFNERQIQFLQTLKTFIAQRGQAEKADLINDPFTRIHPQGIRGVFTGNEINEVLGLINHLAA